jgi:hypothetical protein
LEVIDRAYQESGDHDAALVSYRIFGARENLPTSAFQK